MDQPRFELSQTRAKLASYTARRELHGDDPKPAASLIFDVALGADLLAMFSPTLRHAFFHKADGPVRNLADAAAEANDLRFPQITEPIKWAHEIVGAELEIDYGLGGKSNITLLECTVDNFTFSPQQGGVVFIRFRVACHPDERQSGKIAFLLCKDDLTISLFPPSLDEPAQSEEFQLGDAQPKRGRRKASEEASA